MVQKYTIHENDAREIRLNGRIVKPLITEEFGSHNMVMYTGTYEAGRMLPAHKHDNTEELIYVLSGYGEIHIEASTEPIKAGSAIFLPRGSTHFLNILSSEPMRILFIYYPPEMPGTAPEGERTNLPNDKYSAV